MTITSNATDGVACHNQSIELTCQAKGVNVTSYKWTSTTFKQAEVTASIIVMAKDDPVEYTCTVTDTNGESGHSSVIISSNGELIVHKFCKSDSYTDACMLIKLSKSKF